MASKSIGDKIKDLLYEKRMTQTELSKKINIHRQVLVNWLNGTRKPKIESLEKIAQALDISVNEFLNNHPVKTKLSKDKESIYKEKLKIKEQEIKLLKSEIEFLKEKNKSLEKEIKQIKKK